MKSPSRVRRSTFRTTRPGSVGTFGNSASMSRPTIARMTDWMRQLVDRLRPDVSAVAHHRDALADLEDLLETMRDEQHRVAACAKRLDDAEQPLDLGGRQRCGRLVHHDHAGVRRQRLGDLDELLVGDREPASEPVRVEPDAELLEQRGGLASHPPAVDAAEALERLHADEDVLGDAEIGKEDRLLEDDRDPGRPATAWRCRRSPPRRPARAARSRVDARRPGS